MPIPILAILFTLLIGITIFTPEAIIELNSHIFGKFLLILTVILATYKDVYAGLFTALIYIYILQISSDSYIENLRKMKKKLSVNEIFETNGISGSSIPVSRLDREKISNEIRRPIKAQIIDKNDVLNNEDELPSSFMPIEMENYTNLY
mgnify:CR=1 FL=1|tara:strand:- start:1847 stop:2293 length:447 start_codon:yes stop_codon:yes gene_type:complete